MTCGVQDTQYKRASKRERERREKICLFCRCFGEGGSGKELREEKRCERGVVSEGRRVGDVLETVSMSGCGAGGGGDLRTGGGEVGRKETDRQTKVWS